MSLFPHHCHHSFFKLSSPSLTFHNILLKLLQQTSKQINLPTTSFTINPKHGFYISLLRLCYTCAQTASRIHECQLNLLLTFHTPSQHGGHTTVSFPPKLSFKSHAVQSHMFLLLQQNQMVYYFASLPCSYVIEIILFLLLLLLRIFFLFH